MIVLQALGFIILGAGVILGGVFGAAWLLAREINKGHGQGCGCPACQQMRQKKWRASHPAWDRPQRVNPDRGSGDWQKDQKPLPSRSNWASTLELQHGDRIMGKAGRVYLVESVDAVPTGYVVVLTNVLSNAVSRIPIKADQAAHRIWLVRKPKGDK